MIHLIGLTAVFWLYFPQPPAQYRKPVNTVVYFVDRSQVETLCSKSENDRVMGCANPKSKVVVMPNPCDWPLGEAYAELMCHELGHINGWKH